MTAREKLSDAAIAVALALIPVTLVLVASAPGPGLSPDSISYLSGARSLDQGVGLRDFTGDYLATFPPGLSITLALLGKTGLSTYAAVVSLNAVMLIVTVVFAYFIARVVFPTRALAFVTVLVFAWSRTTIEVFSMLWSEPMFTALTMAILLLIVRSFRHGHLSLATSSAIGVLIAAAIAIRYSGLLLAFGTALASLAIPAQDTRNRIFRISLIVIPGFLVLALIASNNVRNGHGYLGDRFPSSRGLQGTTVSASDALGSLAVWRGSTGLTVLFGSIIITFAIVGTWFGLMRRMPTTPLASIVFTYMLGLIISQSATRLDDASERLAYPIYLPLLILVAFGIRATTNTLRSNLQSRWPKLRPAVIRTVVLTPVAIVVTGVVALGLANSLRFSLEASRTGIGYQSSVTQTSPVAQLLRTIPSSDAVISNEPWLVSALRPTSASMPLPPSPAEWPEERLDRDKDRIADFISAGGSAWIVILEDKLSYEDPIDIPSIKIRRSTTQDVKKVNGLNLYQVLPE